MSPHKDTPSRPGYVTLSPNFIETEKVNKMRIQRHMFQMKERGKIPHETEVNNLPNKEFKAIVTRMLTGNRIDGHSDFKKKL